MTEMDRASASGQIITGRYASELPHKSNLALVGLSRPRRE
jgi:hypothetical protein